MVKQLKSLTFVNDNISNTYQVSNNINPDWNQNDETAADYVKNRTHWIGDPVETVLLEETSIELIDTNSVFLPGFIKLIEGCTYFVTFNRTEYECVAYDYNDMGIIIIGNGSLFDVEGGNGEPFALVFMEGNTSAIFVTQEAGTYALKIVGMIPEVVQLPAQFLVNSNICNGEGEYSINEGTSIASGDFSHAEGESAIARGNSSHAEGYSTIASGNSSHAEGYSTIASGNSSHTEGDSTMAKGNFSHAEGSWTIASSEAQHVQGIGNIEDTNGKYAHIVGNGTRNARSNAHTIDWKGNAWFAGKIYIGGTGQDDENAVEVATKNEIISLSSTATVGQTIVVKSVDDNGVPTEWEAVDFPERAQSDWNQNDETAPDYIKNRTHYEYLDDANLVLPMSTVNCDVEGDDWGYITEFEAHYTGTLPTSINLDSSNVFTVFLDGQYYECIPDPIWGEEGIPSPEYVIVGSCIGGNLGNAFGDVFSMEPELPFAICGDTIAVYEQGEHTVAVWKGAKSVKKLDEKFLPDSMKQSSYIATIGTTWEENSETGVKYQVVAVPEMTADNTAKVDTVNTHTRNSEGYALYVEEQNQFLEFITNGDAETVDGGIKFYIYGEPNTVEIPIIVEVS